MREVFQPPIPIEEEKLPEKGCNVRVTNYWNRHAQKKTGEVFDAATGGASLSDLSPDGQNDSLEAGRGIEASKHGILRTYVSNMNRTAETAKAMLDGIEESNPGASIGRVKIDERLNLPMPAEEPTKEFFAKYEEMMSDNKARLLTARGLTLSDFDSLSSSEQAEIAEAAEEPVIREWLRPESELSGLYNPAFIAKDFGRLFYLHSVRIPSFCNSGSEVDLLHVTHHGIMEPFLISGILLAKDGQQITSLEQLGGSLYLLEGWKSISKTDKNGELSIAVEIRGKEYDIDMEMLKEMGTPGRSR